MQIFSLAILLSSFFVYNQLGAIDEKAVDALALVTKMTQHIRVRAQTQGAGSERDLGAHSPGFLWLLRDFYLDLKETSPSEYLEEALRPMADPSAEPKNKIRASIKSLFPDRQCFTLVRPANEEATIQNLDAMPASKLRPEFNDGMSNLLAILTEKAVPKKVGDHELRGPMLARLATAYVDAINKGAVPVIHTAWQVRFDSTSLFSLALALPPLSLFAF